MKRIENRQFPIYMNYHNLIQNYSSALSANFYVPQFWTEIQL